MFRRQAEHFALLGSPVYAELAGRLAEDPAPLAPILQGETSHHVLAFFGAVHHHALTGAAPNALSGDWADFTAALIEHELSLRRFVEEQGVQTNETQRCVALVPAFLTLARETGLQLDLVELGPSAGLNLVFDRYGYRYAEGAFGEPESPLVFDAKERGRVPGALLRRRFGSAAVAVSTSRRSTSRTWTTSRSCTASCGPVSASAHHASTPRSRPSSPQPSDPSSSRVTTSTSFPASSAQRSVDALTVVFQTASTGYLEQERYDALLASLDAAAADGRPLAWVSSRRREEKEHDVDDFWELELRVWPAPARVVALVDHHGNWLDWVG